MKIKISSELIQLIKWNGYFMIKLLFKHKIDETTESIDAARRGWLGLTNLSQVPDLMLSFLGEPS